MSILVFAEHHAGELTQATHRLLAVVNQWGLPVHLLLASTRTDMQKLLSQASMLDSVDMLLTATSDTLLWPEPTTIAGLLKPLCYQYQAIVTPHQSDLVAAFGLLAGMEGHSLLTDTIGFEFRSDKQQIGLPDHFLTAQYDQQVWRRHQYTPETGQCILLSIQTARFSAPELKPRHRTPVLVCELTTEHSSLAATTQDYERTGSDSQRLDEARIVLGGGRPLGKRFMQMMKPLATQLSASIGATRGAVDAGLVPFSCQIGQTGSNISPELYIAVGLSGAPQHMAGISQSQVIVAINKDISAPICQQADYILQGDMFELVPQLCEAIATKKAVLPEVLS